MNELCFQLRRDQRKQRTVSHLSFSLRRDFPVRFDPRFFPSPPPNTYAARTFPKTRSIFREARFHRYYPCTVVIRFTNNAHSLSLTDKNPLPPLFLYRADDRGLEKTDYARRRGVDRFFQSWRPQDLDKARALSCT